MLASFETERDRLDGMINNRPGSNRPQAQAAKAQTTAEAAQR